MQIEMKPHHFMDMIKLHGAGYDTFLPDEHHHHSFYSVGNTILQHKDTTLSFTLDCDDVCEHCISKDGKSCTDSVTGLGDYTSKDIYNKALDQAIIEKLGLDMSRTYTAREYCELLYQNKEIIYSVWSVEPQEITKKRYQFFCRGAECYLDLK